MKSINIISDSYIGKFVTVYEQISKKDGSTETNVIEGELKDIIPSSWVMVSNNGIPFISPGHAVKTIVTNAGIILYHNSYVNNDYNPRMPQEIYDAHVQMFGLEETKRVYEEKSKSL